MFTGFPEATLQFFLDIRFHNEKSYFEEHRARYERDVKAPFHAFIEQLAPEMRRIDPLMEVRPYKCLARIHRDTRFSRDKSPFRDHLWLCFRRAAEPREGSVNFFFELGLNSLSWGMGTWGENRPMMDVFRRRMAANPGEIKRILEGVNFPANDFIPSGSNWKRMEIPASVPPELHDWYTLREVYIGRGHPDMGLMHDPRLADVVLEDFRKLAPVYELLRGAADEAK